MNTYSTYLYYDTITINIIINTLNSSRRTLLVLFNYFNSDILHLFIQITP